MLKFEIKFEKEPDILISMSKMIEDIIGIEEGGDGPKKSAVLQFESINMKDYKIEFNANDRWDVKENLLKMVRAIEEMPWVNAVIEVKRSKK